MILDCLDKGLEAPFRRNETEVMSSWREPKAPYVSICCATFNHEKYISRAIEGFLYQITKFPFEIILRDDASTDKTCAVILEYKIRFPNIIRTIIEPENQFKYGIRSMHIWPKVAKGKFIALCEGDDFWVNPYKLQKQIDLLERYPDAVMSVAKTDKYNDENGDLRYVATLGGNGRTLQEFNELKSTYFHTSSYVIRSEILKNVVEKYFIGHTLFGDTALRYILSTYGYFVFLPEIVSVYRSTGKGIWSSANIEKQLEWDVKSTRRLCDCLSGNYRLYQSYRLARLKFKLQKHKLEFYLNDGFKFKAITCIIKTSIAWTEYKFNKYVYRILC